MFRPLMRLTKVLISEVTAAFESVSKVQKNCLLFVLIISVHATACPLPVSNAVWPCCIPIHGVSLSSAIADILRTLPTPIGLLFAALAPLGSAPTPRIATVTSADRLGAQILEASLLAAEGVSIQYRRAAASSVPARCSVATGRDSFAAAASSTMACTNGTAWAVKHSTT
ncbi:hypothetical protein MTO96_002259 [Rhipicephalus appendiculatus]